MNTLNFYNGLFNLKTLTFRNKDNVDPNNNIVDLTGTFDTAWTKKGRQHNSMSGKMKTIIML